MEQLVDLEIIESLREVGDARDNDEFVRELFALFSEQSEMSIRELGGAVERNDLAQVRYYAHRLKGSAANIGATQLARRAEAIEAAIRQGLLDTQPLAPHIAELVRVRELTLANLSQTLIGEAPKSTPDQGSDLRQPTI